MTLYPAAAWKPVQNHGGPISQHLGLVFHVQEGDNSLYGWFNNPSSQVSAHFWVSKTGATEQYVDTNTVAWAEAAGNPDYLSVETEGFSTEALTDPQLRGVAALFRWCHDTYGIPLATTDTVGGRGLAWHGMGGAAWGGHYNCPGSIRLAQRPQIVQIAAGSVIQPKPPPLPQPTPDQPYEIGDTVKVIPINATTDAAGWFAAAVPNWPAGATKNQICGIIIDWSSGYDPGGWNSAKAGVDFALDPNGVPRFVIEGSPNHFYTGRVYIAT